MVWMIIKRYTHMVEMTKRFVVVDVDDGYPAGLTQDSMRWVATDAFSASRGSSVASTCAQPSRRSASPATTCVPFSCAAEQVHTLHIPAAESTLGAKRGG